MDRKITKVLSIALTIAIFISSPAPVYANKHDYSEIGSGYQQAYAYDVYRWWQGSIPNDNSLIIPGGSDSDAITSACSYFSAAYMLVKMDLLRPEWGETPITVINKARAIGAYATSWGLLDWTRLPDMYPEISVEDVYYNTSGMSLSEVKSLIWNRMNRGEFVIACIAGSDTNGHYIFIDGFDEEGDLIIGDSARPGYRWTDVYGAPGHSNSIVHIETFTCENKLPFLCSSIYTPTDQKRRFFVTED